MENIFEITIGVICVLFVYMAFKHVSSHEKSDEKIVSKILKRKKTKKK